jgi:hypothetical protein
MYTTKAGLIIGFHGCDLQVRDKVINQDKKDLKKSRNEWDWLGNGIYFWENNPQRALEFAKEEAKRDASKINEPAVLDLGYCLDLLDSSNLLQVKDSYNLFVEVCKRSELPIPMNIAPKKSNNKNDKILRNLDCAVIELLHRVNKINKQRPFDSVRGIFTEGEPLYDGAGFRIKDHIQICIRNPNCIKGYFMPRELNLKYRRV